MKHQKLIDAFRKNRDEFDGYCDIIWLPAHPEGGPFHNVLPGPCVDIIAAFIDVHDKLSFLKSSENDREQEFVKLGELPFSVQKKVFNYIFQS